ncbi:MAG: LuxR family transcriptional regulator [Spirochaetaceae bacterium]|nr:MAG: LuxR family transcriptional regulator [Spirochaetaceae bacterium]
MDKQNGLPPIHGQKLHSILLLLDQKNSDSELLKQLYQLPYKIMLAYSVKEAENLAADIQSSSLILIMPGHFGKNRGINLARDFYYQYDCTCLLYCSEDSPVKGEQLLPGDYLHGCLHTPIRLAQLNFAILSAIQLKKMHQFSKKTSRLLDQERRRSRLHFSIIDSLNCIVQFIHTDHRIISLNKKGYEIFGVQERSHGRRAHELLGREKPWEDHPGQIAMKQGIRHCSTLYLPEIKNHVRITTIPIASDWSDKIEYGIEIWEPVLGVDNTSQIGMENLATSQSGQPKGNQKINHRHERLKDLTKREWEIIPLLLQGAPYQEIADQLSISLNTIKSHIANIYKKTGCSSRTQIMILLQNFNNV